MDDALDPGLREELITRSLDARLSEFDQARIERRTLEAAEVHALVRRHADRLVGEWLKTNGAGADQAALVNQLAAQLSTDLLARYGLVEPPQLLTGILPAGDGIAAPALPERPQIPLTANELLVNDRKLPSIGSQLRTELQSAERVDLICAFAKFTGVSTLLDVLRGLQARRGTLRVITTTYMAATELKALRALDELGAEIRVAYDAERTKLHAKAWILHRPRGLTTAFVGSSNLSVTAMHAGLEWNVRLAEAEAASVIDRMNATFETYWEEDTFEPFVAGDDDERLEAALAQQRGRSRPALTSVAFAGLEARPHGYQRRMLEDLAVQRERHDRHRNLIVAATGTGKTVVAAFDYAALCKQHRRRLSLLFVAHRDQILQQSRATFQAVLQDPSFGEIRGGGEVPTQGEHVFAMVQSLRADAVASIDPRRFDVVIVDEFHHAQAPSYTALLEHLEPMELLGLTATPERMDGKDVTDWFGGRIAVELRVWDAIDRGYLAPFQYFGVADPVDFSQVAWRRGRYDQGELSNLVTGYEARVDRTITALHAWHPDPATMRALGFCVSVDHAHYMAEQFTRKGFPSVAIDGRTPDGERHLALQRLKVGELRCVFSVDVLGEGVDVPNVDTILLLRPTQSATVFAQQLGRGLRLSDDKACLIVFDLIGQQHRQFRFEERLRAIVDERNGPMRSQAEEGFPFLPSGCSMVLDRQSNEIVLENLRRAATATQWRTLVDELRDLGDVDLGAWARQTGRRISDLYRAPDRSWTRLRREAGLPTPSSRPGEEGLLRAMRRQDHIDDPERVRFYTEMLARTEPPRARDLSEREQRLVSMLLNGLGVAEKGDDVDRALRRLWPHASARLELQQLLRALDEQSEFLESPLTEARDVPLALHGKYTRHEALLACGDGAIGKPPPSREGVRWMADAGLGVLFVTLRKSERSFSPSTMYRDYALSRTRFHWESQNANHDGTWSGRRYVEHQADGVRVLLFVRETESRPNGAGSPFTCLGPVTYDTHSGNRPMQVIWNLENPLPESLLEVSQLIAAA